MWASFWPAGACRAGGTSGGGRGRSWAQPARRTAAIATVARSMGAPTSLSVHFVVPCISIDELYWTRRAIQSISDRRPDSAGPAAVFPAYPDGQLASIRQRIGEFHLGRQISRRGGARGGG